MLKSLEISAEGLAAQMLKNDVVANNLANATTTAFKRELTRFSRELAGEGSGSQALVVSSTTDFTAGTLKRTNNPLDLAIEGGGFFVIETDAGDRYIRGGEFTLSDEGVVVTRSGQELQGNSGPIQVDITEGELSIASDGTVSIAGVTRGAVKVVRFGDDVELTREGGKVFRAPEGVEPEALPESEIRILPGHIEESNINPLREMVAMITALRTFQSIERSIKSSDEILDTMINQLARVPNGS